MQSCVSSYKLLEKTQTVRNDLWVFLKLTFLNGNSSCSEKTRYILTYNFLGSTSLISAWVITLVPMKPRDVSTSSIILIA